MPESTSAQSPAFGPGTTSTADGLVVVAVDQQGVVGAHDIFGKIVSFGVALYLVHAAHEVVFPLDKFVIQAVGIAAADPYAQKARRAALW